MVKSYVGGFQKISKQSSNKDYMDDELQSKKKKNKRSKPSRSSSVIDYDFGDMYSHTEPHYGDTPYVDS